MVVVELGELDDPEEREQYLEFLAENDIQFARSNDGKGYSAKITLVNRDLKSNKGNEQDENQMLGNWDGRGRRRRRRKGKESLNQYDDFEEQEDSAAAAAAAEEEEEESNAQIKGKHLKEILKGSRPTQETRRMLQAFQSSNESSDFSCYTNFCSLIETKKYLEPRNRSLKWILGIINDLYDERARFISLEDKEWTKPLGGHDPDILRTFPVFVMDHLSKRYGLRRIIDQVSWDLVYNVHAHRRQKITIEVFARFLEEYYDSEDLSFFLQVKNVVDKVVQKSVRAMWTKEFYNSKQKARSATKSDVQVFLKWPEVVTIARQVYGERDVPLNENEDYNNFLDLVDEHCVAVDGTNSNDQVVETHQLLHLAVAQFHDTRAQFETVDRDAAEEESRKVALEQVFEKAKQAYQKKLEELGFAQDISSQQMERDMGYQQRLDEMCLAIKKSLLRNEETRDSMPKVNELKIQDWATELLGREPKPSQMEQASSGASRFLQQRPHSKEQDEQVRNEFRRDSGSKPLYTSRRGDGSNKREGPSPPTSPHPPRPSSPAPSSEEREQDGGQNHHEKNLPNQQRVPTYEEDLNEFRRKKGLDAPGSSRKSRDHHSPAVDTMPPPSAPPTSNQREKSPVIKSKITPEHYPPIGEQHQEPGRNSTPRQSSSSTELVMREIHGCLDRCKESYMQSLMVATEGLPPTVIHEIEKEVRSQLDQKARMILNDVIGGGKAGQYMYDSYSVPDSCSYASLEANFKGILRVFNESDGSYYHMSKQVDQFCHNLLSTTELRQEIEPLVALLVTYASARLGGVQNEEYQ